MEKVERTLIETCNIWEKRLDSKQPSQSSGISPQHVRGGGSDPDPDQIRSDQIQIHSWYSWINQTISLIQNFILTFFVNCVRHICLH